MTRSYVGCDDKLKKEELKEGWEGRRRWGEEEGGCTGVSYSAPVTGFPRVTRGHGQARC